MPPSARPGGHPAHRVLGMAQGHQSPGGSRRHRTTAHRRRGAFRLPARCHDRRYGFLRTGGGRRGLQHCGCSPAPAPSSPEDLARCRHTRTPPARTAITATAAMIFPFVSFIRPPHCLPTACTGSRPGTGRPYRSTRSLPMSTGSENVRLGIISLRVVRLRPLIFSPSGEGSFRNASTRWARSLMPSSGRALEVSPPPYSKPHDPDS